MIRQAANALILTASLIAPCAVTAQAPPAPTPAPAPAPPPAAAAAPAAPMVESIKIICDGKAKNDGAIAFVFTAQGAQPAAISVTIEKGMNKKDICRDIAKEVGVKAGAGYTADHYDDDKVKIEGKDKAQFSLTMGSNSVTGVTIELK